MNIGTFLDLYCQHCPELLYWWMDESVSPHAAISYFLDIGSNSGQEIDWLLADKNPPIEIHAFEPHPMFFDELCDRIEDPRVFIYPKAFSTQNGKAKFFFKNSPTARNGGATLVGDKTNVSGKDAIEVTTVDSAQFINNVFSGLQKISVLKIDVEGAEYDILYHLAATGALDKVKCLIFEDHSRKVDTKKWHDKKKATIALLKEIGIELHNGKNRR